MSTDIGVEVELSLSLPVLYNLYRNSMQKRVKDDSHETLGHNMTITYDW